MDWPMLKGTLLVLASVGLLLGTGMGAAWADEASVPTNLLVKLSLKALSYDRGMASRGGGSLPVGVLYAEGDGSSGPAGEIAETVSGAIGGKPLSVVKLRYSGKSDLAAKVASQNLAILYVCPGLEGHIAEICEVTQGKHVATVSAVDRYVAKGITMGVGVSGNKPKLMINITSAAAEGSSFSSSLLQLAEIQR
jgi:hypothetical protein